MSKYQNTEVGGIRTRTNRVLIDYKVNQTPVIRFNEEEVVLLADGSEKQVNLARQITFGFDPTATFELRNPETDEVIEGSTSTQQDAFVLLYSLFRAKQEQADAEEVIKRSNQPISEGLV